MTATVHDQRRLVLPKEACAQAGIGPGDVVEVTSGGVGKLVLVRREQPEPDRPTVRVIRRRGRHPVGEIIGAGVLDEAAIHQALAQFP